MDATLIEQKCVQLSSYEEALQNKRAEYQNLTVEIKKDEEKKLYLQTIARLSGKTFEENFENEDLIKVKKEIAEHQKNITRLNIEILNGLKEVEFDLKLDIPTIDAQTTIHFEKAYPALINYLASILLTHSPIQVDNIELHQDRIVVNNASNLQDAAQALETFHNNIRRLAYISRNENDPTVDDVAKYLHDSNYKEIWESVRGRKQITTQKLYDELHLLTPKDKKKVRNFFSNLRMKLKNDFPFLQINSGSYALNFFGSLVWKRYQNTYLQKDEANGSTNERSNLQPNDEKGKRLILNNFLTEEDIKKTIYGKKVVD